MIVTSEVNSRRSLAEQRHDERIHRVGAGKLHVESQLVRRNAVQHELAGVGVFALVTFQGKIQQPQPDHRHQHQNRDHEPPRPMLVEIAGAGGRCGCGRFRHARPLCKSIFGEQANTPQRSFWKPKVGGTLPALGQLQLQVFGDIHILVGRRINLLKLAAVVAQKNWQLDAVQFQL
jgi:hypothetical protein